MIQNRTSFRFSNNVKMESKEVQTHAWLTPIAHAEVQCQSDSRTVGTMTGSVVFCSAKNHDPIQINELTKEKIDKLFDENENMHISKG